MELVAHEETAQTDPRQTRVWKRMMIMRMMEIMIFNPPTNRFQVSSEYNDSFEIHIYYGINLALHGIVKCDILQMMII